MKDKEIRIYCIYYNYFNIYIQMQWLPTPRFLHTKIHLTSNYMSDRLVQLERCIDHNAVVNLDFYLASDHLFKRMICI